MAPPRSSLPVKGFVRDVRAFCRLIETRGKRTRTAFLGKVSRVLPRVYAGACQLPQIRSKGTYELRSIPHSEWDELFSGLRRKLGSFDRYWLCFWPYVKDEPVRGSLADDLADIYRDLKPGLEAFVSGKRGGREAALW